MTSIETCYPLKDQYFDTSDYAKDPTHPVTNGLRDLAGEDVKGKFYEPELQKVIKTDDVYEVEKVLKQESATGMLNIM
jgi:hypothetical protein